MSLTTMYDGSNNSIYTTLTSTAGAADTTINVVSTANLPTAPNIATIGVSDSAEVVLYTGKTATELTGCTRGFGGTTAATWAAGQYVYRAFTKYDHDTFKDNIEYLDAQTTDAIADIVAIVALSMSADRTIYVATTGNDSTGDGTSGTPYATITKALSVLPKNLGGYTATINVAAGTYTDTPIISGFYAGNFVLAFAETVTITGQIKLTGNKAYITSTGTITVNCDVANQGCIDVTDSFIRFYQNMTLANSNASGRCLNGSTGAFLVVQSNASDNTATLNSSSGRGVVARLCAQVFVNVTSGTCNTGYYSDASIIRVKTDGMTVTTKVTKTSGGTVLTGAGADLT